ncbi:MAG: hypothetical protein RLZZ574_1131, partial [Cyanobacteriota bacterium]
MANLPQATRINLPAFYSAISALLFISFPSSGIRATENCQNATTNLPSLETIVRDRIGDQTIRKNAVLCVEMLLTASPEYFRPDNPSQAGYYEPERLADFQQAVHNWLDKEYGDRLVRAELHLDESTPHVHAYFVPL